MNENAENEYMVWSGSKWISFDEAVDKVTDADDKWDLFDALVEATKHGEPDAMKALKRLIDKL